MKKISALLAATFLVALIAVPIATPEGGFDLTLFNGELVLTPDPFAPTTTAPMNLKCNGTASGTYHDVVVPPGANCLLAFATVTGNVTVQQTGGLIVQGSDIHGNVQGNGANYLSLYSAPGVHVGGNLQIQHTTGNAPGTLGNYICFTTVDGDLQLGQNSAPYNIGANAAGPPPPPAATDCGLPDTVHGNLQVTNNSGGLWIERDTVDGNLQAYGNTNGVHIYTNTIGGNLQCGSNNPPPDGAGNTVGGSAQGQCATPVF
jgi:hypothetical protein